MRFLAAIAAIWLAAGQPATAAGRLGPEVTIVVVEPDITLSRLSATGQPEERPEWGAVARTNVAKYALDAMRSGGRQAHAVTRAGLPPDAAQILLLHNAVRASIRLAEEDEETYPALSRRRDWTLGAGAQALDAAATHALIITGDGDVTGAARAVFVVGAAAMGVLAHTGLQRASASLIDLRTGDIIWRNAVVASPEQDMRDPDGAHRLVTALLAGAPL